jgi:hypothetical protein
MIQQIQKTVFTKFMSIFLLITFFTWTNQNLFAAAPIVKVADSKEFFKALFFLDSELLNNTPNLKLFKVSNVIKDATQLAKYRVAVADIINKIDISNPTFLNSFAKEVTSGNQIRVKVAMEAGIKEIEKANSFTVSNKLASNEYKTESSKFLNYINTNKLSLTSYTDKANAVKGYFNTNIDNTPQTSLGIVIVVVGVALAIIAVTVAIVVDGMFWGGTPASIIASGQSLQNAELINEVAIKFNGLF